MMEGEAEWGLEGAGWDVWFGPPNQAVLSPKQKTSIQSIKQ